MTWAILKSKWFWRAAGVLALIAAFLFYRNSLIEEGEAREQAKVAQAVAEQKALADAQTQAWRAQANETDAKNQELQDELRKLRSGNSAGAARLRDGAPSAKQLAGASPETCGANASEAEHDLGECAVRYSALGDTASDAAAKAWELYEKWPAYTEFHGRLDAFKAKLNP